MKKLDFKKIKINKDIIRKIFVIIVPLLILYNFESDFLTKNKTIFLAVIIIYSLYGFLLSIFKNTKWSILIICIMAYIISTVTSFKLEFTSDPFYVSDILYAFDASEIVEIVDNSLGVTILKLLPVLLFKLFSYTSIILLGFYFNTKIDNIKKRIICFAISFGVILVLFLPIKATNKFIIKKFYAISARTEYGTFVTGEYYYQEFGFIAGIYGTMLESRVYKPDNYNEEEINRIVLSKEKLADTTLGKPNIIVVFSESFWDIDQIDEVTFNKPITENFNKLKEKGLFFNMISPSFGGISSNVEFEFLTGGTLNYFGMSYVPYMNLYNNNQYYDVPSIIHELNNNGYYTKIVPFSSPNLFSCGKVYNYMQFDEKEFIAKTTTRHLKGENVIKIDENHLKGQNASEEYVADKIIEQLNNKNSSDPIFYMTLTMQAHMPYNEDKYDSYDIEVVDSELSEDLNKELRTYAQGIYDADKQLGRLYDFIMSYDEPTIIVFYGDHLPKLEAMNYLDYFNTDDKKLNLYRKYNTQSLIVANFDITSLRLENREIKYLSPDLLSAYILNHMDINISNYYSWLYSTKDTIAASNRYIAIDPDGELYYTSALEGEMKELYDFRESVQYKYFIKK